MIINICGYDVLIDDEDAIRVLAHEWHIVTSSLKNWGLVYFRTSINDSGISLHRFILRIEKTSPKLIDHKDHNTLNNQKANLRACNDFQNQGNRGKNKNNTSGYKGVVFDRTKRAPRWRAFISISGKRTHLGSFDSPIRAHEAYCRAATEVYGEYARFD